MNDLISRSQLLKEIETWGGGVEALHEYIKYMPTAYSVDKVVEELEGKIADMNFCEYRDAFIDALEIVKQGGVSDDVCEWKVFDNSLTDEPQWVYETTCGKYVGEEHTSKAFVYCPYCSKRIKVVE